MLKRSIFAVVILAILAGGAYAIFHKSNAPVSSSSSSQQTTSGTVIQTKNNSSVGNYLADSKGNALYTYGADTNGVSNCDATCLYNWPAYVATTTTNLPTNVTVITRSNGDKQYAYKGLPLYTFSSDTAGQVTGDGVENFHVAKP